jgi:hypothetical protein
MVQPLKHKHHIVPRYEGGSDDPSNLVELTPTQHAMWHFAEWQRKGREEDRLAWRGLSGHYSKEEIMLAAYRLGHARMLEVRDAEKDTDGKSLYGKRVAERLHSARDEQGKSLQGLANAERLHFHRDEKGRSLQGVENANKTNSVRCQCLVTGKISSPPGLTSWQRARGIDTNLRVKL